MTVEINIPAFLQPLTGGTKLINVNGKTLAGCLDELVKQFPGLQAKLYGEKGKLLKGINIFINRESVYREGLTRLVNDGDIIHITYVTVGG